MFYYHTFKDLNISGIYDHEPLLPCYHFPQDDYWIGKNVLDIGCASGFFSKYFAERKANVTSVDINTYTIKMIKEQTSLTNIEIVNIDLFDIKYQNKYDFVFCGSLLMHVFYPMGLLKIIYNSMKIGGLFTLCTGGLNDNTSIIRVEKYMGRNKISVETEIKSANESLWWISPSAGINMLHTIGFNTVKCVDSFMLTSTPYGVSIGHNFSALHHVWHGIK